MMIAELLQRRVLVLDGAMGTMIQSRGLKGNNDHFSLTHPDVIEQIHVSYLEAGADLIETNTFNANRISQADYGLSHLAQEMNRSSARLARRAADRYSTDRKPRFVAGSVGPTNKTASISPNVDDPSYRSVTFDELVVAYEEQIRGLIEGGADLLLIETIFDTLNAKAALFGAEEAFERTKRRLPLMISATLSDQSYRTLSGQTLRAFLVSIAHADLLSVGLNCSFGAREMLPALRELSAASDLYVTAYPNAGLPNRFGAYDESPDSMAECAKEFLDQKLVNVIGGCCGTTPDHIRKLARLASTAEPRVPPILERQTQLSGLEPLTVTREINFVNIGERTNVMGSRKFASLIREEKYDEALSVAREQVDGGAQMIDVCMDESMIDAESAMRTFLNCVASDPSVSRVPIVIDSSKWPVIEAGLKCVQGKGVVNSISLKEGEETFKLRARMIRRFGAAAIVMAFDERGQADTFERKIEVCGRAYRILTEEAGFPAEDVILDPNVLAIGTGIEAHNGFAVDYIRAVRWIKEHLPGAKVSGGVSNLSFAFRGNEVIRRAIHTVFLKHAIEAGMDMGIVNPSQLDIYDDISKELREAAEDLVLNRRPDATDRMTALATETDGKPKAERATAQWRGASVEERLRHALIEGIDSHIEEDVEEARKARSKALQVIEGPLMAGMNAVGELFAAGKMFLPQVIKSARVMKKAVAALTPHLEREKTAGSSFAGRVLLATVKGDVHDIGKNIVAVVLGCNNYEVIDLGVMVPAERILKEAEERKVDLIGLSGLITPSLEEMAAVATEMERRGLKVPLLIGGATTSEAHTAVKIAPNFSQPVIHVKDASKSVSVTANLLSPERRESFLRETNERYEQIRKSHASGLSAYEYVPLEVARKNRWSTDWSSAKIVSPRRPGITEFKNHPLEQLVSHIDWTFFFHSWRLNGKYPTILDDPVKGEEARKLLADARAMIDRIVTEKGVTANGVVGIFPANSVGDDIEVYANDRADSVLERFYFYRDQRKKGPGEANLCVADFVAPKESGRTDFIGGFTATAGIGIERWIQQFEEKQDDYGVIMSKILADRFAEAFAEWLHAKVRDELWGFGSEGWEGLRPAYGYPSMPDHTEKRQLFDLIEAERRTSMSLTETYAMFPAASVCGLYLARPEAKYFDLEKIQRDQVDDYARRTA
ncbi:MAG: methionine synthase [Pseudomonadota bacterium]